MLGAVVRNGACSDQLLLNIQSPPLAILLTEGVQCQASIFATWPAPMFALLALASCMLELVPLLHDAQ